MNKKILHRLNVLLFVEMVSLAVTTGWIAKNWNCEVTVGLNATTLLWVEIVYLLYINFKERE
jgi:hypothetical protein